MPKDIDEGAKMSDWISTGEAAKILGVTPSRVRQLIRSEVLEWRRIGARVYLVSRESVYEYDRDRRG